MLAACALFGSGLAAGTPAAAATIPAVGPTGGAAELAGVAQAQIDLARDMLTVMHAPGRTHRERVLDAASKAVAHRAGLAGRVLPEALTPSLLQQHRNLDAAADLLALAEATEGDDALRRAVHLTKAASRWQARTLGLPWIESPRPQAQRTPGAALMLLAARHGVEPHPDQVARIEALDSLPEPLRGALAGFADAFLAFDEAVRSAYASADAERLAAWGDAIRPGSDPVRDVRAGTDSPAFNRLAAAGVDLAPVFPTRNNLLDAVVALQAALDVTPREVRLGTDPVQVPPAFSIDLSEANTVYTEDYALLLDAGGDDVYLNNAGGSNLQGGACPLEGVLGGAAALIDLGGDDRYGDPASPRSCGANGGGALGAGLLVDAGGTDTFDAGQNGVNGGGNFGAGLLVSTGGDNVYTGTTFGVNGGSEGGAGMLIDLEGADTYTAGSRGTNGGSFGGSGFLLDAAGNDTYRAGSVATNGGASASGAGFLLDAAGDDLYTAGNHGSNGGGSGTQGAGFLLDGGGSDRFEAAGPYATNGGGYNVGGVGMLVSLEGDDRFVAAERGTNGGAHGYAAAGFLVNGAGDDIYQGGHSGSNGGARQGAAGLLFDASGDDHYFHVSPPNPPHPPFQGSFGTNGGAYMGSIAALIDGGGNDTYEAGRMGVNGGAWRACIVVACFDAVGLLLDAGGTDRYEDDQGGTGQDRTVVPKGTLGAQVDLPEQP